MGKAYPAALRHRVLNDAQYASTAEVAAKYRISKRTVDRWRQRLSNSYCPQRPDPATLLTPEVLEFIARLLTLDPCFTNAALSFHVYEAFHVRLPVSTIAEALVRLRATAAERALQRSEDDCSVQPGAHTQ